MAIPLPSNNVAFLFDQKNTIPPALSNKKTINTAVSYTQKSHSMAITTGSDVTSLQVLYEQGGNSRGLNLFIENGKLFASVFNYPEQKWGYKELSVPIEANKDYSVTFSFTGTSASDGTAKLYLNGQLVDTEGGIGLLYKHSGDITIGSNGDKTVIHDAVVSQPHPFKGEIHKIVQYNADLSGSELQQLHDSMNEGLVINPPAVEAGLFDDTVVPATPVDQDTSAVELGMRFTPLMDGAITGIQFFKGATANSGPHIGHLWSSDGTMLGEVVFTSETASGWQTAKFLTAINVSANQQYVISYHAPKGQYAVDENAFSSGLTTQFLSTPADAGVYAYGSAGAFPASSYKSSNYFVDVIFQPGGSVPPVNNAPVAQDDVVVVNEDSSVVISPLLNDSDKDGNALAISALGNASNGTAVLNANGTVTYTPNANFSGTDAINYTVDDGKGGSATATIRVTVNPVNDAPVASSDQAVVDENGVVTITLLANDSDRDGDILSVVSIGSPANGTAVLNANNTVTYTPKSNFDGNDSFTYTISDGKGATHSATVNVTVNNVVAPPPPPPVVDDNDGLFDDTVKPVNLVDPDASSVVLGMKFQPLVDGVVSGVQFFKGSATNSGPHTGHLWSSNGTLLAEVVFTNETSSGWQTASFTTPVDVSAGQNYVVSYHAPQGHYSADNLGFSAEISNQNLKAPANAGVYAYGPDGSFPTNTYQSTNYFVDVVFQTANVPGNNRPDAQNDVASMNEDTSLVLSNLLANDLDADGDVLAISSVGNASNGTVVLNSNGTVSYTPQANFSGNDSFTYSISDGKGGRDTATVNVTVKPAQDAPIAKNDAFAVLENNAKLLNLLANDVDPDGDVLNISNLGSPAHGSVKLNADGTVTYTPNAGFTGIDTFNYQVSDGKGGVSSATVNLTITPPFVPTGGVFYVSTTGSDTKGDGSEANPWKSINFAMSKNLAPGDTVLVKPGVYNENVSLYNGGSAQGYVTLKSEVPGAALIRSNGWSGIDVHTNYVSIEGFDVQSFGGGDGIQANDVHHIKIIGNIVHDNGESGIQTNWSEFILIEGNITYGNAWGGWFSGISLYQNRNITGDTTTEGYRAVVRNNISYDNFTLPKNGPHTDGNGIIIDDFQSTQTSGFSPYLYPTLVDQNLVYNNGGKGIQLAWSDNVTVSNNTAYHNNTDNANSGTWRGELSNQSAYNNTWINNIAVSDPSVNSNNSTIGSYTTGGDFNTGTVWLNNLTFTGKVGDSGIDIQNGNGVTAANGNLLGVNPGFVDAANGNFHLLPNSVAIDAGSTQFGFQENDLDGTPRLVGSDIDLGAFEFAAGETSSSALPPVNQMIMGDASNNVLTGTFVEDVLYGGSGNDRLIGGQAADKFIFKNGDTGIDTISDFNEAEGDVLDLSDFLDSFDPITSAISDFVQFRQSGSNTVVAVDADGGGNGFVDIVTLSNRVLNDYSVIITDNSGG